jgi:hypothetical protein
MATTVVSDGDSNVHYFWLTLARFGPSVPVINVCVCVCVNMLKMRFQVIVKVTQTHGHSSVMHISAMDSWTQPLIWVMRYSFV